MSARDCHQAARSADFSPQQRTHEDRAANRVPVSIRKPLRTKVRAPADLVEDPQVRRDRIGPNQPDHNDLRFPNILYTNSASGVSIKWIRE